MNHNNNPLPEKVGFSSTSSTSETVQMPLSPAKAKHTNKQPKQGTVAENQAIKQNQATSKQHVTKQLLTYSLHAKQLKRCTDPDSLPTSTLKVADADIHFGQNRAIKAIHTALGIKANGYNIFAAGENGLGKRTLITRLLQAYAKQQPTPNDWVYVHNFDNPRQPIALSLPAGQGKVLADDVQQIWTHAKKRLNQRFRGDWYQSQIETIKNMAHAKESEAYDALNAESKQYDLQLQFRSSDNKAVFVKAEPEEVSDAMSADAIQADNLDEKVDVCLADVKVGTDDSQKDMLTALSREQYAEKNHMHKRLNQLTIALEALEDEANDTMEMLHKDIATRVLQPIFATSLTKYAHLPAVLAFLQQMQADMIRHVERIVNQDDEEFMAATFSHSPSRYSVNVMVSHEPNSGAPIVFEDLPTHLNLLGHVEQITQLGTVTTDVSMVRPGALHRANGGFLLIEASNMLEHAYAWQGLKRALQSKQIRISSLEQMLTLTGSLSLAPAAIDLSVKVILLGEASLYYELIEFEPEFDAVFKVRADFHDDVLRNPENEMAMVAKMADMIAQRQLRHFDQTAQAAIIDHLSLLADHQNRLSLHSDRLAQLLSEADRHACLDVVKNTVKDAVKNTIKDTVNEETPLNKELVTGEHVACAIYDMNERSGYLRELYWQDIQNGQQLINTQGQAVGQVNALTVISYADSEFGMPARLTALIQPSIGGGQGDILDIERDVNLGGNIHAKGMLIMTSYLRALFSRYCGLNFSASLAFEQSYAHIDGDSATIAEACALISALADVPIFQSLAITGSMNQLGEVQAVGGINAKVAGFYDACFEQGLTGKQGVIIPNANVNQLMLRDDIIQAVEQGHFNIYAVQHLHEVLHILTGLEVDSLSKKGNYRKHTLFAKVIKRLKKWERD